ncbi:translation initiation factor IF-3 [Nostoc sp. NIES-2111]
MCSTKCYLESTNYCTHSEDNLIAIQKQLINSQIKSPQVFLIDHENNNRGLINTNDALELAESLELDLVVVSQGQDAPIAKILNYGKLQYQKKKRQGQSARPTVKEVRLRPNIGAADYNLRIEQAVKWLSKGDSVKFAIRLRGRENQYREQAGELLERAATALSQVGKVQSLDRRSLTAQIIPA